jgi:hypothetical protein
MIFFYKISSSLFVNRNEPAAIRNFGSGSRRQFNFVSSAPAPLPFYNTKIYREKCIDVLVRCDFVSCFGLFQVCQRGQESRCEANTGAVPTLCNRIGCQGRNLAMNYC